MRGVGRRAVRGVGGRARGRARARDSSARVMLAGCARARVRAPRATSVASGARARGRILARDVARTDPRRARFRAVARAEGEGRGARTSKGFIGGLLVGGAVFGALGFLFAPQLSKTLLGGKRAISKALDEEAEDELEVTRQNLNEKIAALNAAIDNFSKEAESGVEKTVSSLSEELNGLSKSSAKASGSVGPEPQSSR